MVTAYYIMKMSKNRQRNELDTDYYNNLLKVSPHSIEDSHKLYSNADICRVCLRKGNIPIYGANTEFPEVLVSFGDIEASEDDDFPKHLCEVCYKFVIKAITFRRIAKQSDETLRQASKEIVVEETTKTYESSPQQSDDDGNESTSPSQWVDDDISHTQTEKKGNGVKYAAKITCNVCNKVMNRSYYKEHLTMHDPNHHKFVCEVCGKSFRLRCAYHNHRIRHRSDFPYKCQFCPYRGRYPELLKNHIRTHTGDYRYMCTECPARFLFKSNLNSHIRKHREPQFKCDSCKRAFHSQLTLQRHVEADHLGIRNHVCSTCGKAFGYRNAMMKHQRHVHKREKLLFGRIPSYLEAQHKELNDF